MNEDRSVMSATELYPLNVLFSVDIAGGLPLGDVKQGRINISKTVTDTSIVTMNDQ